MYCSILRYIKFDLHVNNRIAERANLITEGKRENRHNSFSFVSDGTSSSKAHRDVNRSSWMNAYARLAALLSFVRRESKIPVNISASSTIPLAAKVWKLFWLSRHHWPRRSNRACRPSISEDRQPSLAQFKAIRSKPSLGSRTGSLLDWRTVYWESRVWKRRTRECINVLLEMIKKARKQRQN